MCPEKLVVILPLFTENPLSMMADVQSNLLPFPTGTVTLLHYPLSKKMLVRRLIFLWVAKIVSLFSSIFFVTSLPSTS
jgi:hypothetical protein